MITVNNAVRANLNSAKARALSRTSERGLPRSSDIASSNPEESMYKFVFKAKRIVSGGWVLRLCRLLLKDEYDDSSIETYARKSYDS
jgi:hypothetical protein